MAQITGGNVTTALGWSTRERRAETRRWHYALPDGTGRSARTYLPSYVDDVLEFANLAAFPVTGETGKMYVVARDTRSRLVSLGLRRNHRRQLPAVPTPYQKAPATPTSPPRACPARCSHGLSTATNAVITAADGRPHAHVGKRFAANQRNSPRSGPHPAKTEKPARHHCGARQIALSFSPSPGCSDQCPRRAACSTATQHRWRIHKSAVGDQPEADPASRRRNVTGGGQRDSRRHRRRRAICSSNFWAGSQLPSNAQQFSRRKPNAHNSAPTPSTPRPTFTSGTI